MSRNAPLPRGERGGQSRKEEARRAQSRQGRASGDRAFAAALGAAPPEKTCRASKKYSKIEL